MPVRDEYAPSTGEGSTRGRIGLAPLLPTALARALTAESDRWFLWVPVLLAGGVLAYFALPAEPSAVAATALLVAAAGTALAVRGLGLGLVVGASLRPQDVIFVFRWLHRLWAFVVGDAVTTLVATAAVAPFAIYHFHRLSHYGVVANLIALPLVSLLIMPFALLSLLAMPFGLEAAPLQVMGIWHRPPVGHRQMGGVLARRGLDPAVDPRHSARADSGRRSLALPLADAVAPTWPRGHSRRDAGERAGDAPRRHGRAKRAERCPPWRGRRARIAAGDARQLQRRSLALGRRR
jgi:Competence protein